MGATYEVRYMGYGRVNPAAKAGDRLEEKEVECDGIEADGGIVTFYRRNEGLEPVFTVTTERFVDANIVKDE